MKHDDGQTNNKDSGILSNPLSFLRSGLFRWYSASLYNRGGSGNYWLLRSSNTTSSGILSFYGTGLLPQFGDLRGYGFAMRCESLQLKTYHLCYNRNVLFFGD